MNHILILPALIILACRYRGVLVFLSTMFLYYPRPVVPLVQHSLRPTAHPRHRLSLARRLFLAYLYTSTHWRLTTS